MKTAKVIAIMLMFNGLLIASGNISAQSKIEKTLVQTEFRVVDDATLQIEHKYGKIVCKNHDQNTVKIKATARFETRDPEKADRVFGRIDFKVTGDEFKVIIYSDFSDKITSKNENLTVDIEIFMPATINLDINQMFGNTFIENTSGKTSINSRYGTLQVNTLTHSNNDVRVDFGNGSVGYLEGGKVRVSYGDLSIKTAGHIQVDSEYSNSTINSAESILLQNEGGSVKIGTVDILDISAKFSDNVVSLINQSLKAKSEYGSLKVEQIAREFQFVELVNSFGSSTLIFAPQASFNFEAEMSFCDLKYPEKAATLSEKISTSFKSSYKGKIGTSASTGSTVIIKSSYGNVDIKMN